LAVLGSIEVLAPLLLNELIRFNLKKLNRTRWNRAWELSEANR